MKKLILFSFLVVGVPTMMTSTMSCKHPKEINGCNVVSIKKVTNVMRTATELSGVLTNTLNLDLTQRESLTDVFINYIGWTNRIYNIYNMDKDSYAKKLMVMNKSAIDNIEAILSKEQINKLAHIGGKDLTEKSFLAGLTGGNNLSPSARGVIHGLFQNFIS